MKSCNDGARRLKWEGHSRKKRWTTRTKGVVDDRESDVGTLDLTGGGGLPSLLCTSQSWGLAPLPEGRETKGVGNFPASEHETAVALHQDENPSDPEEQEEGKQKTRRGA